MPYRRGLAALSLLACSLPLAAGGGPSHEKLLTNEGLVMLAQAGYNERFLTELVQAQPHRFDTSVEGLVYLARQGVSEKMVRLIIGLQKQADTREAERAAAEAREADSMPNPVLHPALHPAPAAPGGRPGGTVPPRVKMRVVRQRMLVPEQPGVDVGANPVIVVEKHLLGDRYYALPGAEPPVARLNRPAPGGVVLAAKR